jgi:AcrR family transcriptional regulator
MKKNQPAKSKPRKQLPRAGARLPRQDRGQRRYEALLRAAEEVIAEVGVDAVTTNAIAARAGSGMGSLYRFFPNKEAIVIALANRYMEGIEQVTQYALRPELPQISIAAMVDEIVDPLVAFFTGSPAYRHVFHAVEDPEFSGDFRCDLPGAIVSHVEAVIAARAPGVPPQRRRVHAMVSVELVHRILDFAFTQPPRFRRPVILETKRLLALYSEMIVKGDEPLTRLR